MFSIAKKEFDKYVISLSVVLEEEAVHNPLLPINKANEFVFCLYLKEDCSNMFFSVENVSEFLQKSKSSSSNSEMEKSLREVKKPNNLREGLKYIFNRFNELNSGESPVEDSLFINMNNVSLDTEISVVPKDSYSGKFILFGGVAVKNSSIDSNFDFYNHIEKADSCITCCYCGKICIEEVNFYGNNYKINNDSETYICGGCSSRIRKKCAVYGENQTLVKKIISQKI